MTGSMFTPQALVAVIVMLACVLVVLYFLARRRAPSAKPHPEEKSAPTPRNVGPPPLLPPEVAALPVPHDGPALPRTVLMGPTASPQPAQQAAPPHVPGGGVPSSGARSGMDEIEHRRRAAKTRLKGERPPSPVGDTNPSTQERVITQGSAAPPPPPPSPATVLLPRSEGERIEAGGESEAAEAPMPARPQLPVTRPAEESEITAAKRIGAPEPTAKTGGVAASGEGYRPGADVSPKPEPEPSIVLGDQQLAQDIVDCSVFAPPRIAAGERFVVQAHLHLAEQIAKVRRAAAEIDRRANLQGSKSLLKALARGAEVELYLACPGLIIGEPWQTVIWEGTPARVLFEVEAPADLQPDPINGVVYLSLDGIPLGDVAFRMFVAFASMEEAVTPAPPDPPAARTRGTSYSCAFVSYARKDFDRVSLFAQGLAQHDVELAFDVASLEPGADWGTKLPALINRCDVFYLMWSDSAAQSKWVEKEARLAVWLHHKSLRGAPRIVPITLHRPAPKPPGYLRPFHFDSPWLAQRAAQAMPLFHEEAR